MSKHIAPSHFFELPSGTRVHPCRLIQKDGTLMWKHALLYHNELHLPETEAHEQHIIKTAQRLEELNSWVSKELNLWDCLLPTSWYVPSDPELSQGISVNFKHTVHDVDFVYNVLLAHTLSHETLQLRNNYLHFKRC